MIYGRFDVVTFRVKFHLSIIVKLLKISKIFLASQADLTAEFVKLILSLIIIYLSNRLQIAKNTQIIVV